MTTNELLWIQLVQEGLAEPADLDCQCSRLPAEPVLRPGQAPGTVSGRTSCGPCDACLAN